MRDDAALVKRSIAPRPLVRRFSILVPHAATPSRVAARFLAMSLGQAPA
ncbi:hypothetical protein BGLA2_1620027 [Burkholderia gladioli]|nr:hypothetical protein BGLA2_1620027 [Burkholderia gladioli]